MVVRMLRLLLTLLVFLLIQSPIVMATVAILLHVPFVIRRHNKLPFRLGPPTSVSQSAMLSIITVAWSVLVHACHR